MLEVHHPGLYRLRSSGPPPYIPVSAQAPPLPPSYTTVIIEEDMEPETSAETPIVEEAVAPTGVVVTPAEGESAVS
jgi:hypothetical protein